MTLRTLHRPLIASLSVVVLALVLLGVTGHYLAVTRHQHAAMEEGLRRAVPLAQSIVRLRQVPATAYEAAEDLNPAAMIADAAREVQIPKESVQRIETLPPRPISGSEFSTLETRLSLGGVTLRQAVSLLADIQRRHSQWTVSQLRLLAASNDTWNVQCALVAVLYTPGRKGNHTP